MKIETASHKGVRLDPSAGIAIGPILFIIAVLGILASAIAAGSGSFTTSTTGESTRAKAAAIIEIGQTLKIGFDRVLGAGVEFASIITNSANTTSTLSLFSPVGGGVASPSVTMSNAPATDKWSYPLVVFPGIGTSSGCRLAVLPVASGVCDEINTKANALAAADNPAASDLGDFSDESTLITTWPAPVVAAFSGKPTGCVKNSNAGSAGNYFYQILGIQ